MERRLFVKTDILIQPRQIVALPEIIISHCRKARRQEKRYRVITVRKFSRNARGYEEDNRRLHGGNNERKRKKKKDSDIY